ncbi:MAG TPA: flagellar FlbD family protein [Terriglobales bacterium]|nr:flagellar FlbD family protein [Terriglobales bacterium]
MCRSGTDTFCGDRFRRKGNDVIQLTRLNHQQFAVNSDLIKFIEKAPDTVVTLSSGEKIVVLETPERVIEKVIEFRRALIANLPCSDAHLQTATHPANKTNETHSPAETPSLG